MQIKPKLNKIDYNNKKIDPDLKYDGKSYGYFVGFEIFSILSMTLFIYYIYSGTLGDIWKGHNTNGSFWYDAHLYSAVFVLFSTIINPIIYFLLAEERILKRDFNHIFDKDSFGVRYRKIICWTQLGLVLSPVLIFVTKMAVFVPILYIPYIIMRYLTCIAAIVMETIYLYESEKFYTALKRRKP